MTKIEIIALQGIVYQLGSQQKDPKPEWMSDDMHRGKQEAYNEIENRLKRFLEATQEK